MEYDFADKRGRVRKKSAKAREMEEFEEEERKHGGKKGVPVEVKPSTSLPVPTTPPTPTKKPKLKLDPEADVSKSPVGIGVMSPAVNPPVSPQIDPPAKGSVIKLLLSSPVQQSPPAGGKSTKNDAAKDLHIASETKIVIKGKKLNIGDGVGSQYKSDKVVDLPPLSVDTNVQSATIGDEGSLKMKFILSPKEKSSDSSKKSVNTEQSNNQALLTMLKSGTASGEKRKILKTKRTDIDTETNEDGKESGSEATAKVVKKAVVKRKLEQTVVVKTNPSSSVEYSLPADQSLDYMDLSSFDFDDEGELIISEDNKTKKLTKKAVKSSPKKAKQSAENEFSLDDSQLASSDVAELAKRVKTAAEKKMGKKVKKGKALKEEAHSKEKKKRPPTAYMLWCNYYRHKVVAETPGADFVQISKRLGELWQNLPEKEKLSWRNKAKKNAGKGSTLISTGKTGGSRTGPPPGVTSQAHTTTTSTPTIIKVASSTAPSKIKQSPDDPLSPIKGFGTEPVDVAAHLKLVGESLCIIGVRLQEHRGLIAVQGSLSVLLDSMLCALGPLMCLTQQLPETNGCPREVHAKTLDNVAYIMPGL